MAQGPEPYSSAELPPSSPSTRRVFGTGNCGQSSHVHRPVAMAATIL
jgi:hypothetical protein